MKPIYVHCHIFKNAGTSLIESFKHAFPDQCIEIEPHDKDDFISTEMLKAHLADKPDLVFISSHRIKLPLPKTILGRVVIPIVFLRDPIDRLGSVYRFEKKQLLGSVYSSLAKMTDLKNFLRTIMQVEYFTMISNVQAEFCGAANGLKCDQIIAYLKNCVFVGVVEDYNFSLAMLEKSVRQYYPSSNLVPVHENVTKESISATQSKLIDELGCDFFSHLTDINIVDLKLYGYAIGSLNTMRLLDDNKQYYDQYAKRYGLTLLLTQKTLPTPNSNHKIPLSDPEASRLPVHSFWVRTGIYDLFDRFVIEAAKLELTTDNSMVTKPQDLIRVDVKVLWKEIINCAVVGLTVRNHIGQSIFSVNNLGSSMVINDFPRAIYSIVFAVPQMISGLYSIDIDIGFGLPGRTKLLATAHSALTFGVYAQKMNITSGCVLLPTHQFNSVKYAY